MTPQPGQSRVSPSRSAGTLALSAFEAPNTAPQAGRGEKRTFGQSLIAGTGA
jgi:hypothetical protein